MGREEHDRGVRVGDVRGLVAYPLEVSDVVGTMCRIALDTSGGRVKCCATELRA